MKDEETIKIYCYAQHCPSRNGGVVSERAIESHDGDSDDWDLVAEGTREEIRKDLTTRISALKSGRIRNSNDLFALRQLCNALSVAD